MVILLIMKLLQTYALNCVFVRKKHNHLKIVFHLLTRHLQVCQMYF